ncbi:uncharacterized protein [Nicotiana sylvestris]|uniref:Uncharacterized protein LOC104211524 isoform X1 n=2 Tax=Nicotiana sylvestris TaxID=4096 RepID=A0A1U7V1P6_NICSY|nr:PREDICTED: uncharacterized protein LOC104211524 isoform X1 [Nicotiana sylvestris]
MSLLDQLPTYAHLIGQSYQLREKSSFLMVMLSRQLSQRPSRSDKMLLITHAKSISVQNSFEKKKQELSASQSASTEVGDTNSTSQLSEMDIWVQSVGGKKKGRIAGLDSLGRPVKALKHSTPTLQREIDEIIKSQVHASNADLYAQLQEERRKNKKMRKELDLLKKYVNFNASSSDELSSQEDNQGSENESDDDFDNVNESGSDPDNTNESDKS